MRKVALSKGVLPLLATISLFIGAQGRSEPSTPPAPPVPENLTFKELRERGQRAYQAQRFGEASAYWTAAAALQPTSAETAADLALALAREGKTEQAIEANRNALRLASSKRTRAEKARHIRLGAYYNLGKLEVARPLSFAPHNDGPSACLRIASEAGCARPLFACGRDGAEGTAGSHSNFIVARFALARDDARIADGATLVPPYDDDQRPELGDVREETHSRMDAPFYDVTLLVEDTGREPDPEEGSIEVSHHDGACAIVHVDACAHRLGLFCHWEDWQQGSEEQKTSEAVELTFVPGS